MKIFKTTNDLMTYLSSYRQKNPNHKIGFVPTMGALHEGHLSLITEAKTTNDIVVCSIFVNPTQFNDPADLEKYPRTIEADIKLLTHNNCDIVFTPDVEDIYPNITSSYEIELNGLDMVLEGKYRPGHFKGVCMVVERLFEIVKPNHAYFGIKDFQQVAIIKQMVKERNLKVNIIACPIKRTSSGLAMSSRNTLLSDTEREDALAISKALFTGKTMYKNGSPINDIYAQMNLILEQSPLKVEYLEIVDNTTLQSVTHLNDNCSICIAAYCGPVRLIDNIQLA